MIVSHATGVCWEAQNRKYSDYYAHTLTGRVQLHQLVRWRGGGVFKKKSTYSDWSRSSAGSWWTCCTDGAPRAPVLSPGSSILCSGCSNPSLKTGSGWDSVPQRPHSHTSYEAGRRQGGNISKRAKNKIPELFVRGWFSARHQQRCRTEGGKLH